MKSVNRCHICSGKTQICIYYCVHNINNTNPIYFIQIFNKSSNKTSLENKNRRIRMQYIRFEPALKHLLGVRIGGHFTPSILRVAVIEHFSLGNSLKKFEIYVVIRAPI